MNASAVVRIYCTSQDPDYDAPWQAKTPQSSTGSGVIIGSHRILTGAHVVANATFVQVQRVEDPRKVAARLVAVCHDADLALLEVDDATFMEDVTPPPFGPVPPLRSRVSVVGFPVGGQEVSVTEGIVSRIEVQQYSHSRRRLLAITVDAAINSGNSGGPVFVDDSVIGIAFQSLVDAENIGEVVPTIVIKRFLASVDEGKSVSVPALSLRTQVLENEALRRSLGMPEDQTGIRVIAVEHGGACDGHVKVGDALLEVDGHVVANNGTIRYADRFRTQVGALLGHRSVGEQFPLVVWRDGARVELQITLAPMASLVERHRYDRRPEYLVYGGLVFQPLTRDFLATWDKWWMHAPKGLLDAYWSGSRTAEVEELVVVTQVLADEVTMGVSERVNEVISTANGEVIRNLAHLTKIVDDAPSVLVLDTRRGNRIVLETACVVERQTAILARYQIPADRCEG